MNIPLSFDRAFEARYGEWTILTPRIGRVLARNPSPFTFKGTGVYAVGGRAVAVIDPGPDDADHLAVLRRVLAGKTVTHILITHTHRDHSPAARALKEWTGATTYAFGPHGQHTGHASVIEEAEDETFVPDVTVRDGDIIRGDGFTFHCLHTPGHTSNHMCYALAEEKALFTGDHVMGWSTSVVAPPDGHMGSYIASLEKLLARDDAIYWPTHGGPVREPKRVVRAYLAHRQWRETQILACLREGVSTVPEFVDRLYPGLEPFLRFAAALSVLAHLIHLSERGLALSDGPPDVTAHFAARG